MNLSAIDHIVVVIIKPLDNLFRWRNHPASAAVDAAAATDDAVVQWRLVDDL